ncbi:hypothetical protein P154DRAFT_233588 [Amniculicola lignicola CBS 123094]|uniref:Uncharacterized protein n=1 Tax=Amniculicola lignicola CBS 123094 TaxID=1392246 RepID=A0A6A5WAY9_9PLEO|nr:hypothetical protein P154DRAFT_233588 [Amniculicola lignicola CBS 123094]
MNAADKAAGQYVTSIVLWTTCRAWKASCSQSAWTWNLTLQSDGYLGWQFGTIGHSLMKLLLRSGRRPGCMPANSVETARS